MTEHELTSGIPAATSVAMTGKGSGMVGGLRLAGWLTVMLVMGAGALGGCISVNAPDKPIVIELNINIKQEVIYRLAGDAAGTIQDNPEIF
jgi:hypothetical protein